MYTSSLVRYQILCFVAESRIFLIEIRICLPNICKFIRATGFCLIDGFGQVLNIKFKISPNQLSIQSL